MTIVQESDRCDRKATGKRSQARSKDRRGRYVRAVQTEHTTDVAFDATVMFTVSWPWEFQLTLFTVIPLPEKLTVAPLIGEAIRRITEERSVSSLFN